MHRGITKAVWTPGELSGFVANVKSLRGNGPTHERIERLGPRMGLRVNTAMDRLKVSQQSCLGIGQHLAFLLQYPDTLAQIRNMGS